MDAILDLAQKQEILKIETREDRDYAARMRYVWRQPACDGGA